MREIKLIGWSRQENKWLPVRVYTQEYSDWQNLFTPTMMTAELTNGEYVMFDTEFGAAPIREYTGVKDKNGVEIFGDDVWRFDGCNYLVQWTNAYAGFSFVALELNNKHTGDVKEMIHSKSGEVIGNIYENQ